LHPTITPWTATGDGAQAAVSLELSIPPLPGAMADRTDEPPLLLQPLRFVDQARLGRNAWWRYVLAVVVFLVLFAAATFALFLVCLLVYGLINGIGPSAAAIDTFTHSGVIMFGLLMALSAIELPILFLVVRLCHRRSWRSLIVGPAGFDWSAFFHSLGLVLAVMCFIFFVEMAIWPGAEPAIEDADRFWLFVGMAVVLVPLQTLAEEAIFRGYVLQGVARATTSFAVRLLVPALLFAVLHFGNAPVANGGLWPALDYVIVAFYLTFLAIRGDGIEHAWGFHLGNNLLAFVLIRPAVSDFDVPSLFVVDADYTPWNLVYTALTCALHLGLLLRFAPPRLARRAMPVAIDSIPEAARP
jgi:CAAX protease family protein